MWKQVGAQSSSRQREDIAPCLDPHLPFLLLIDAFLPPTFTTFPSSPFLLSELDVRWLGVVARQSLGRPVLLLASTSA